MDASRDTSDRPAKWRVFQVVAAVVIDLLGVLLVLVVVSDKWTVDFHTGLAMTVIIIIMALVVIFSALQGVVQTLSPKSTKSLKIVDRAPLNEQKTVLKQAIKVTILVLVSFIGLLCVFNLLICSGMFLCESGESLINIHPDAVYGGAATIVGLATFGSILSLRFSKSHKRYGPVETGTATVLASITALIFVQGFLMLITCCGDLTQNVFVFILAASLTCLLMAIWGLSYTLDPSFRDDLDRANDG